MKRFQSLTLSLLAGGLALAMVTTADAQAVPAMAKVVRIHGNARMTTGNNVWQPLKVGALVGAGTVIQTAKDSYVDLVLGDNNAEIARSSGGSGGSAGTGGGGGGGHASAEQNT